MPWSVSAQGSMQGMMHAMESSTPSTIKSACEPSETVSVNTAAMTPTVMGMGADSGASKLMRMIQVGNYGTDDQEEHMLGNCTFFLKFS